MAEFGIQTLRPNGSIAMDGYNKAGMVVDVITVWYGSRTGGNRVYNDVPAGSLFYMMVGSGGGYDFTVGDDGAGHANISWTYSAWGNDQYVLNSTADTVVIVFAKKINQTTTFGAQTFNNSGDLLMDYTYPVPQYAGSVQAPAQASFAPAYYWSEDGWYMREHTVNVNVRPTTSRLVMLNLPDSTSDNIWYTVNRPFIRAGETSYVSGEGYTYNIPVTIIIYVPFGKTYKVPTLHIFSLDGPLSGGGTFGIQYLKPDGTLVYDSSAENISIKDQTAITFPVNDGYTQGTLSLNLPAVAGVVMPYLREDITYKTGDPPDVNGNDANYEEWLGMLQRKGNTLYYMKRRVYGYPTKMPDINFNSRSGVPRNTPVMVVDIEQLNPGSVTGTT